MSTWNWLSLFGVPAIILGILTLIYSRLNSRVKKTSDENKAIKLGIQALLRDRLYEIYSAAKKNSGATHFERENFNNIYSQYHALGANGVMDDIHDKFFELPIIQE